MHRVILKAARALVGADLEVTSPAALVVEDGRIAALSGPEDGAQVIDLGERTLLPGFIDAHVHIGLADPRAVVAGGVTTVRDLAWPADAIFPMARASRGWGVEGPLILCAGPMLTVEDGYPTRAAWAPEGTARVVRSPQDGAEAVGEQADAGAAVIKVALNAAVGPTLDAPTLRAVCDAARKRGLRVTAHIFGLQELLKALDAGVGEMAHMLLSPEAITDDVFRRMVAQDMAVVPTLAINRWGMKRRTMLNLAGFLEAGGRVVYGTDLGNAGPQPGIDRREIDRMSRAGMDPKSVVAAGTTVAASWLGLTTKGVLAPGMDADIIAVDGDPLDASIVLHHVAFVMREGQIVVGPEGF